MIHYHDGEIVTLCTDRAKLRAEVERFEGLEGVEGLEGFLKWVMAEYKPWSLSCVSADILVTVGREAGIHASLSYSLILSKTFPSLFSLLRPSFLVNAIALHPLGSLWSRCCRYFKTERFVFSAAFESEGGVRLTVLILLYVITE